MAWARPSRARGEGREGDSTALVMEKAESPWRLAPCVCVCVCRARVSVRATYPHR